MENVNENIGEKELRRGKVQKNKNFNRLKNRRNIFVFLGLLWPLIHFCVFFLYVNLGTVYASFFNEKIDGTLVWDGFKSYADVFRYMFNIKSTALNSYHAWLNTLSLMALAVFVNLPITLAFSYMLFKKMHTIGVLRILLYIPNVLSVVILCLFFKILFSGTSGYQTNIFTVLSKFGFDNEFIIKEGMFGARSTAWPALLIFSVWTGVSGNIIYFNSTMARLPAEVLESAGLDGAGEMRQFFSIVLPMIWSTIVTMTIMTVGGCFGWFMPAQIMVGLEMIGTIKVNTVGWIIVNGALDNQRYGFISAFGVVVAVLGGGLVLGLKALLEKIGGNGVEY